MNKIGMVLSNAFTCGYSVLTMFSWRAGLDMKYTFTRNLWWIFTVIICISVVISIITWIAKEFDNA